MEFIRRGRGTNPGERFLAQLADRAFLDLWSYPNTFINKRAHRTGDGKELCDLLVIFDDHILVFSDKECTWNYHVDPNIAWRRWYKRSVIGSRRQLLGAMRWITDFPDRIFVDPQCEQALPLPIPNLETAKFHLISIVSGLEVACKTILDCDDGSLMINPHITDEDHENPPTPFSIGDVNSNGEFIHVFDRIAISILLKELDTISDFCDYISKRKDFLREKKLIASPTEADLLTTYIRNPDEAGRFSFPSLESTGHTAIFLGEGLHDELIKSEDYISMKIEDKISYAWDRLILNFSKHVLNATSVEVYDHNPTFKSAEMVLRIIASERRFSRRFLGSSFVDALKLASERTEDKFARIILPQDWMNNHDTAFVFLILRFSEDNPAYDDYYQYRRLRASMGESYCFAVLEKYRDIRRVVLIAVDGHTAETSENGTSEDIMALECDEWNEELIQKIEERKKEYKIFDGNFGEWRAETRTLTTHEGSRRISRQQRRALERKAKKRKRQGNR